MSLRVSAIIFQLLKVIMPEKCALLTILELNWNQRVGQDKIEHLSAQLQKRSFHVIERTRTSSKCQKMKNARAKILCFIVKFVEFLLLSSSLLFKLPSLAPRIPNMETTVPFGRAISVRQLPFAVVSDNVF